MRSGDKSRAQGEASSAFGTNGLASGTGSGAYGMQNTASGAASNAFGVGNVASGERSTALGNWTVASGGYSSAFGFQSKALNFGSTAIGFMAVADRDYAVWVGAAGSERQIIHLADGTQATDAVNLRQLQAGDAQTLAAANAYTDVQVASVAGAAAAGALDAAKDYADAGDAATLASANAYTDAKAAGAAAGALGAARDYADAGDAATLASARDYTDVTATRTLASANAYTDQKFAGWNDPVHPVPRRRGSPFKPYGCTHRPHGRDGQRDDEHERQPCRHPYTEQVGRGRGFPGWAQGRIHWLPACSQRARGVHHWRLVQRQRQIRRHGRWLRLVIGRWEQWGWACRGP